MLKPYREMRQIDVSPYTKERDGIKYLPWGNCKELLHENGADVVYFLPVTNSNGSSLIMSDVVFSDKNKNTNRCYEVRIHIVIDDMEWDAQFPLMNGSNPVKDNSMSQQRVWNAQTRAFVKAVAMRTGLGFSLWLDDYESEVKEDDLSKHKLSAIKERLQQEYSSLLARGLSTQDIATGLNMTKDEVKSMFGQFDTLQRFESNLTELIYRDF